MLDCFNDLLLRVPFFIAICIYDNLNHEEFDAFVFQLQDDLDQMSGFQSAYNIFHV